MFNGFAKKFPDTPYVRENIIAIQAQADKLLDEKLSVLPLSVFLKYEKCGDREEYEQLYMNYRKHLLVFLSMALWSEDEKWITAVEDTAWAICDMFTWEVPARFDLPLRFSEGRAKIGLFAAETAFSLCETLYLLEDRLSDMAKDRIRHEIRERIIEPYCKDDHDWSIDWGADNWSAVCGGQCGMIVMYMGTKPEVDIAIKKSLKCMQMFLSSYKADGACLEGPLYWEYGFGFFCMFAAMVREYTNGEIDLFADEKVKNIARFGEDIYLDKNCVIPFSDSAHNFNFNLWLFAFLAEEYGIKIPDTKYAVRFGDEKRYRIPFFLRSMFLKATPEPDSQNKAELSVYKESQWYIKRTSDYILAAKGGFNAEPHNHNDVGSFVLFGNGEFVLDDLGWGSYEKGYFGEERYSFICASSFGHSVPIINGQGQLAGEDKKAVLLECSENEFKLDLSAAYKSDVQFVRSILPGLNRVEIKDNFSGNIQKLCERFVTFKKPQLKENGVMVGTCFITADCKNEVSCSISETEFAPRPNVVETVEKQKAYFIDFAVLTPDKETEVSIRIDL